MKTIEEWKTELNVADWLFAATKTAKRWGEGKTVDQATFEKAVEETGGMKFYAYAPPATEVILPATPAPADSGPSAMPMSAEADTKTVHVEDRHAKLKR